MNLVDEEAKKNAEEAKKNKIKGIRGMILAYIELNKSFTEIYQLIIDIGFEISETEVKDIMNEELSRIKH